MNLVRSLLFPLVLVVITLTLLLASATGVGALLYRLMPGLGLGTAVLICVVALTVSLRFVLGLLGQVHALREELDEAEIEELVAAVHRPARKRRSRR
jgi:hypothetical protein